MEINVINFIATIVGNELISSAGVDLEACIQSSPNQIVKNAGFYYTYMKAMMSCDQAKQCILYFFGSHWLK